MSPIVAPPEPEVMARIFEFIPPNSEETVARAVREKEFFARWATSELRKIQLDCFREIVVHIGDPRENRTFASYLAEVKFAAIETTLRERGDYGLETYIFPGAD